MTDIFGVYNIRSRISVGLVVLAPLLIQAYMLIPEVRNISSTFVITIITFALSNLKGTCLLCQRRCACSCIRRLCIFRTGKSCLYQRQRQPQGQRVCEIFG